jgi:hypothetical protein
MNRYLIILFFALIALCSSQVQAQRSCRDRVKYARQLFESGQIEKIPAIIDSCINKGLEKELDIQAYRLLIQTYLFDYNREKAKETMFRFLKKYPDYKFTYNDPIEIKDIFYLFKVRPNWGFGFNAGLNFSQVQTSEIFSIYNLNSLKSEYNLKIGYFVGIFIEKYLGTQFSFSLGFDYKVFNYENTESNINNLEKTNLKETTSWFSMPLTISYTIGKNKFAPFLFTGGEFGFLLRDVGSFSYNFNAIQVSGKENVKSGHNLYSGYVIGGIGIRYKVPAGNIKFWIGYNYNLTDFINQNKRYSNTSNIFNYRYIDDDLKLNHFIFKVSYSHVLYKIKAR